MLPAAARARRAKPGATRRQAGAQRTARREDYGWGGAGGVIKPNHAAHHRSPPMLRPKGEHPFFNRKAVRGVFRRGVSPSIPTPPPPRERLNRPPGGGPPGPRRSDAPLFWLDPLAQSCDVSDNDAAVISRDQTSPFERAEHQGHGFPSGADIARNLLMGELHTDQDSP